MTLQDLASFAEVVGAIATVAALIYLSIQIRANTISVRIESRRASLESVAPALVAIAENGELARIFNEGLLDFSKLNSTDGVRFAMFLSLFVSPLAVWFDETRLGVGFARSSIEGSLPLLRTPGGRQWWRAYRDRYNQEFQNYIDREILQDEQTAAADRGP